MTLAQEILLESLKRETISIYRIEPEDLADEMIWWAIENGYELKDFSLTEDMVKAMIRRANCSFNPEYISIYNIKEEDWIEGIENSPDSATPFKDNNGLIERNDSSLINMIFNRAEVTEVIATAICTRYPFLYDVEEIGSKVPEDKKQFISNAFFERRDITSWGFELSTSLPISEEAWGIMLHTDFLRTESRVEKYIKERNDAPQCVRNKVIEKLPHYICYMGKLTAEDVTTWLKKYKSYFANEEAKKIFKYIENNTNDEIIKQAAEEQGWLIEHIETQTKEICKIAIKCDPHNIQYVRKQTNELMLYALSLDKTVASYLKKTKAVCKALGLKCKKKSKKRLFADENYLVKFKYNLADEGNLIKVCIVKGSEMNDFLNQRVSPAFGNLTSDEELYIEEIVTYKPITNEELEILNKFELASLVSGQFRMYQ